MRIFVFGLSAVALAACSQQTPAPAGEETPLTSFEDNGCIGALMLHRAAVIQDGAEGDAATLTAALEQWRVEGLKSLSAGELTQYEASSIAVGRDADLETLAAHSATCVANAPSN